MTLHQTRDYFDYLNRTQPAASPPTPIFFAVSSQAEKLINQIPINTALIGSV